MSDQTGTRIARTAAVAANADQDEIAARLAKTRVLIELENIDASGEASLYAAVRQAVLMWTTVTVNLPTSSRIAARCCAIAEALRPRDGALRVDERARHIEYDGVLHIGPTGYADPRVVSVTHSGWVMHMYAAATEGASELTVLPTGGPDNELAAIGTSALGIGELFLRTVGVARPVAVFDLSLWDYAVAPLGSLPLGPTLPTAIHANAFLVGAGTVGAGFTYAISPVEVTGLMAVVDHDAAWGRNFGPHLYVTSTTKGTPKVNLLEAALRADHPHLDVIAKAERLFLFRPRIGKGVPDPDIVISGLDKARPRHEVQRLWAPLHLDMATDRGLQVQLMVRSNPGNGECLIRHFTLDDEADESAEIARRTGLSAAAIADALGDITDEDIANAPEDKRAELDEAKKRGERRCNVITRGDLGQGGDGDEYLGSSPFGALLAGVLAAVELLKVRALGMDRDGIFVQYHFVSRNVYAVRTRCSDDCACDGRR